MSCGGAYMFVIRNSAFERDGRYVLSCPYCKQAYYIIIEDGRLLDEDKASKHLKNLPVTRISTQSWFELLKED